MIAGELDVGTLSEMIRGLKPDLTADQARQLAAVFLDWLTQTPAEVDRHDALALGHRLQAHLERFAAGR